jgi:hypothetical protein
MCGQIHGEPAGVIVTVTRNAAGKAQDIVVNHCRRNSLLLLSRAWQSHRLDGFGERHADRRGLPLAAEGAAQLNERRRAEHAGDP